MNLSIYNIGRIGFISLIPVFALFGFGAKTASASGLIKPANNLGLVAYYSFEDATGTMATDFSGNGSTGTFASSTATPVWSGGRFGRAVYFDGGDFVDLGNPTALQLTGSMTISAFIKQTSAFDPNGGAVVNKLQYPPDRGYALAVRANGIVSFTVASTDSLTTERQGATTLEMNRWYHILGAYNASAQTMDIYLDGVLDNGSLSDVVPASQYNNSKPVYIGARQDLMTQAFPGIIDEVRMYNRVLAATEALALYGGSGIAKSNSSLNNFMTSGLVGLWSFDGADISGTTAYDKSGQGNNGTLVNGPRVAKGRVGQGIRFDGTNDQVQTLNQFTNTSFSYTGWFKTTATSAGLLLGAYNTQSGSDLSFASYHFYLSNDGKLRNHQYPGIDVTFASTNTYNDGNWHQFVVTFDNVGQVAKLYLDGSLDITNSNGFNNYANYWVMGAGDLTGLPSANSGVNYFNGYLDDVRIYNRLLSADEIQRLYRGGQQQHNSSIGGITNGLVLWHTFDGPRLNATTSTDSSGQGNNGTLSGGPRPTKGKVGQALRFDGVDDYVNLGTPTTLQFTSNFTLSAWVNRIANGDANLIYGSGLPSSSLEYYFNVDNSGDIDFALGSGAGACRIIAYSSDRVTAGAWHHVVVIVNSSKQVSQYVDGAYLSGGDCSSASGNNVTAAGKIGAYPGGKFKGLIDDVRVYNRALSAAEVLQLYNNTK